jgi:hypothetical protein
MTKEILPEKTAKRNNPPRRYRARPRRKKIAKGEPMFTQLELLLHDVLLRQNWALQDLKDPRISRPDWRNLYPEFQRLDEAHLRQEIMLTMRCLSDQARENLAAGRP